MTVNRRKLIEVSLPLEAINEASVHEKAVPRRGHPATLHLWWARRPLAAARAVLFAQLVDDPSSRPERYPTEADQQRRREELHTLIKKLVTWENSNNRDILAEVQKEILDSTGGHPPTILDPFAGGGTIPLEAQRLGLRAVASDLNPVAVLINKALIEIPPKFKDNKPVFPGLADSQIRSWQGAQGLAADIRAYGQWIRDEAEKRVGHIYPKAALPDGTTAPVIAWIWARTVTCPNPRCRIQMPLIRSRWLFKKKGKEAYVVPTVVDGHVQISIGHDPKGAPTPDTDGTVSRTGATCISCGTAVDLEYIRAEGRAGKMGAQLMTTVAGGDHQRIYLPPTRDQTDAARVDRPANVPDGEIALNPRYLSTPAFGMTDFSDLFTARQLIALTTVSDLVTAARDKIVSDAIAAGNAKGHGLADGGTGAVAYADSVATYLAFAVSKLADWSSSLCGWINSAAKLQHTFARQAIPMLWDYAEIYPFSQTVGNFSAHIMWVATAIEQLPAGIGGSAEQVDALKVETANAVVSTDPPYYDNIGYSDLSDFFYVWLRRTIGSAWPELFATILVPKAEELVANPYRHNGNEGAKKFFENGFTTVFARAREHASDEYPITVFYAFKQSESTSDGTASSGWETLLEGMVRSGWMITGTWPMRSERGGRMRSIGSNALASSILLVLRPRPEDAPTVDRRGFIAVLRRELPDRLRELQHGAIAPVDLPQAAIGPGMAVFTRYGKVIESDGSTMSVRSALARINEALDEVLSEQEGDFDATTRFAISWYRQHGYDAGVFGAADNMARARNTSVAAMERAGILRSRGGKVGLLSPTGLLSDYDPVTDPNISAWEVLHHLIRVLDSDGVAAAGVFLARVSSRADGGIDPALVKELAFLLFSVADNKRWPKDAIAFNNIATSWSDLIEASRSGLEPQAEATLDFTTDEEES